MKQFITEEELRNVIIGRHFRDATKLLNKRFTEMTTQKQPEPLPEFEPFDIERARNGEDVYDLEGSKAKQYGVFDNDEIVVLWGDSSYTMAYMEPQYYRLRHKCKAKPIEFNSLLDRHSVWNKPSDFDKVELIGSNNGEDIMKATKGNLVAYYTGKFNDGTLK